MSYTKLCNISSSFLFKMSTKLSIYILHALPTPPINSSNIGGGVSCGISAILSTEQFHLTGVTVGIKSKRKARGKTPRYSPSTFGTVNCLFLFHFGVLSCLLHCCSCAATFRNRQARTEERGKREGSDLSLFSGL